MEFCLTVESLNCYIVESENHDATIHDFELQTQNAEP